MNNYTRATFLVIVLWFVFCVMALNYNGPFFDEGIYITAGLRSLQGFGVSDGYLTWFAGSLLWPMLAGLGYTAAGLVGTRLVALILTTVTFVAVVQAARNLFGSSAGFWTALAFALSAPLASLARLGVYDVPALTGMGISFWAITELVRRDHRGWLALAVIAFAIGLISKYPLGLMVLPIAGIIYALRGKRAIVDLVILGFTSAAIILAFFLPFREQMTELVAFQLANKPTFGTNVLMIAAASVYISLAPFLLALGAWFVAGDHRQLATILLLTLFLWPAYHILSANPSSLNKHLVAGFLFAYPLIGFGLAKLWRPLLGKLLASMVVAALATLGWLQLGLFDAAWPDVRVGAAYLNEQLQQGQNLLINNSWPYTMYLYAEGRIESPWAVFDVYRITHGESTMDLCEFDWFVDEQGSYAWPTPVLDQIQQCGTFREVLVTASPMTGLSPDLTYTTQPVRTTIYENTAHPHASTGAVP